MFAGCLIPVENCRLADLGSGAGFPGLALKIAQPRLEVRLIESNKKKCAFLSEIVRSLELERVEVVPMRFDEIRTESPFAELITVRALGGFSEILDWAKGTLTDRGQVILWIGGEDAAQVSSTPGWAWQAAVKIPDSQRRYVLIGRPQPETKV
jgi:16S rRNA (guanine527-N7)-methyltransferase